MRAKTRARLGGAIMRAYSQSNEGTGHRRLWATVLSIQTGPPRSLTINLAGQGEIAGIRFDSGYEPTVGDSVYGHIDDGDFMVYGKVNT